MSQRVLLTKTQIKSWLATLQLKAKYGEKVISLSEVARMIGVHRDTIYEAIEGRMSESTQLRLNLIIKRLEPKLENKTQTKLAHVSITNNQIKLGFGISTNPLLK